MALESGYGLQTAIDLVGKALGSGAIKLKGVDNTDYAESNGKADAAYLIALLGGLQAELPK